jgi:hypothetical protein
VLTDREVSPQLGLLKSTLLQLDSTFSERTYGAGSFRDFAQKLAAAGYVTVREAGRNVLVELSESGPSGSSMSSDEPRAPEPQRVAPEPPRDQVSREQAVPVVRAADAINEVRRLFQTAQNPPRWPMYIRQAKQFMKNVDASFDERRYGFSNLVDLLRACQREGLFRIERDRQGVMRIFPGNVMQIAPESMEPSMADSPADVDIVADSQDVASEPAQADAWSAPEPVGEPEIVDGAILREVEPSPVIDVEEAVAVAAETVPPKRSRSRSRRAGEARHTRKAPAERKAPSKPRSPRAKARAKEPVAS